MAEKNVRAHQAAADKEAKDKLKALKTKSLDLPKGKGTVGYPSNAQRRKADNS